MVEAVATDLQTQRDALIGRILGAAHGVFELAGIYFGETLGLYAALARTGWATSSELAAAAHFSERYVREWLEHQAVSGFLAVDDERAGPLDRRYRLPEGHLDVLANRESLDFLGPFAQLVIGVVPTIREVAEAFRTGGGVPYARYSSDMHQGQAGQNRNLFLYQLGQEYLPAIADLHARLSAPEPARIADLGCGFGWSSIGMAMAYPNVLVDGFDLDEGSVAAAQELVRARNLDDRVSIRVRDAADPEFAGRYDLVTAYECVHDMADPVGALATMRRLAGPAGTVLVMDERAHDTFTVAAGDIERILYGFSLLHCLPVGMDAPSSAGTGAVMRPETFAGYARAAGFREVEILPIDNAFFNFYRLRQ